MMKVPEVIARTSGAAGKARTRQRATAWLSRMRQTVEVARRTVPELEGQRLDDVKIRHDGPECRVTLVFRETGVRGS